MKVCFHADSARWFPARLKNNLLPGQSAVRAIPLLLLFHAALGAGPALRYIIPFESRNLTLIAKWIHEFYTRDRFAGDYIYFCFATRL